MKKRLALSSTHLGALGSLLALPVLTPAAAQETVAPDNSATVTTQSTTVETTADGTTTVETTTSETTTTETTTGQTTPGDASATLPELPVVAPTAAATTTEKSLADERIRASEGVPLLTLEEAIYLTIQNNPQREAAQAALAAAQARIGTARSAGGLQVGLNGGVNLDRSFGVPTASFGGGGGTGGGPGGGAGGGGSSNNGDRFLGFDVSQQLGLNANLPIYTGGRVKASTRVAQANTRAQAAQVLQIGGDLVLQTISSYTGILRGEQLLQVAESNLAVSQERLRIAEVRFDAGAAPRLEVLRAQTTLADSQTRRINASNALAQNKASLNILLGRAPETPLRIEPITRLGLPLPLPSAIESVHLRTPEGTLTEQHDLNSGERLRAVAERTRPTIAVAREQLEAAEANIGVAKAQRRPNIGASLTGLLRNPVTFAGRFVLGIGLSVAQTLFDSGRSRSQINEAQATRDQAKFSLDATRLNVANQIEQSLLALDSAEEREKSSDSAVVAAQEALRAAQIGYAAGVRTALEVTDAQDALLQAQTQAVNARFDVAEAQARLATAVGVLTTEGQAAYNRALQEETVRLERVSAEQKNTKKKKS